MPQLLTLPTISMKLIKDLYKFTLYVFNWPEQLWSLKSVIHLFLITSQLVVLETYQGPKTKKRGKTKLCAPTITNVNVTLPNASLTMWFGQKTIRARFSVTNTPGDFGVKQWMYMCRSILCDSKGCGMLWACLSSKCPRVSCKNTWH